MHRFFRSRFFVATVTLVASLGFGASRAWSDAGGAAVAAGCPEVQCVESHDGDFCLCRAGADVATGEKAVLSCESEARGACCISPVGFCYCSAEATCTFPEDRPTDRCDRAMEAPASARCAVQP
jgi:hypothetical protein